MKKLSSKLWLVAVLVLSLSLGALSMAAATDEPDPWTDLNRNICEFTYKGEQYTLVFGMYDENTDAVDEWSDSGWPVTKPDLIDHEGEEFSYSRGPFAVTIFRNLHETDQEEVSAQLRAEIIKNVEFSYENKNEDTPAVSRIVTPKTLAGRNDGRWYVAFYANYYESSALIHATVTLADGCTDSDGGALSSVKLSQLHHVQAMPGSKFINCAALGIDTQEELQELLDTLPEKYPSDAYEMIDILLDAVDYGDITCNVDHGGYIGILGTSTFDENNVARYQSTLSSLTVNSNEIAYISGVKFVAPEDTDTVAVSVKNGKYFDVHKCSFYGYDTAVKTSGNAYIRECANSLFYNCKLGFDCGFAGCGQSATFKMYNCSFKDCEKAVDLHDFPENAIAYNYRIYNCDFINSNHEHKDILSPNKLYAFGNYFDHAPNKDDKVDVGLRYLSSSGLTAYLMYQHGYSETPAGAPDWKENHIGVGMEADHVQLDKTDKTIFGDGLLLDADSFDRDTDLIMDVVDESGSVTGTWIFESESEEAE